MITFSYQQFCIAAAKVVEFLKVRLWRFFAIEFRLPYAHLACPFAPPPPRPFTSKTWLFLMLPCCTLHFSLCSPLLPPKSWAPPCQAARTSDDLRSHNRNPKCSSAALAHACFLRGYRLLPRAQATPVVHNLTPPVSVSSSEHPWPGHDDVRGRSGPDDVHGLVRSQFSASMVQP